VAGFVCSLCGVIGAFFPPGGFLLSLVGFVLSLIAMGRSPRGFAVAGVVLGFIGMGCLSGLLLLGGFAALLAFFGIVAGAGAVAVAAQAQIDAVGDELRTMDVAIVAYQEKHEAYPTNLGALVPEYLTGVFGTGRSMLSDPWGKPFVYRVQNDGLGYTITSSGPDRTLGTADDKILTRRAGAAEVSTSIVTPPSGGVEAPRPRYD
jgi:hypothetical protein